MKKLLTTLFLSASAIGLTAQVITDRNIFLYSPNQQSGLHVALQSANGWHDLGQLCASDYGTWGAEKKMHHPSVTQAKDGSWRLVFQVNDRSPVIAVAYSRDLITWRPQDYPQMSVRPCQSPVVFENEDGTFDICFRSPKGKRHVTATADFRRFSPDEPCLTADEAWLRDTATIKGHRYEGNLFAVSLPFAARLLHHFEEQAAENKQNSERMHDDPQRFQGLTTPLQATLRVDLSRQKAISDKLIGVFFEDISYAADGGLYAELVQNRDFEYSQKDRKEWNATTAWASASPIDVQTAHPLSANNPHYAVLKADTLWNSGWEGIAIKKGKKYDFSVFVCPVREKQALTVQLVGRQGQLLASGRVVAKGTGWQQLTAVLKARQGDTAARLALIPEQAAGMGIDMVSLFPQETFMNRKNGLRKDLAETIAALKPKFVRFPGGCMSHGQGLDNIYHWSETIGPLQDRKPDFNIWHYHQTRGLGFYEYFQFCEDIGAEPLPVLAAGVPCQNSQNNAEGLGGQQGGIPMKDMPAYIQELLDLIDWANGDPATSPWARKRAEAGHPAPFNLKYIGIGNEDIISTVFEERYEMICRAIREKYPDIKICGTVGPFHAPSADYIEGWDFTRRHPDLQFMTDEHYYESTGWFLHHRDYYDHYPRPAATQVYLGEWAASTKAKRPNVETALTEALYLTDIERNGDVVWMTSYAPMLAKDGHHNWNPDMIYFTNTEVKPTLAYEVQRLFGNYCGDRYVSATLTTAQADLNYRLGASVVSDSRTGKTYVKLVNALPTELNLNVEGLSLKGARGERFSGKPEDRKADCTPLTLGDDITLPPYSLTVVEI